MVLVILILMCICIVKRWSQMIHMSVSRVKDSKENGEEISGFRSPLQVTSQCAPT